MAKEMYRSWFGKATTKVIKKNTVVRGRGRLIFYAPLDNGAFKSYWYVFKEHGKYVAALSIKANTFIGNTEDTELSKYPMPSLKAAYRTLEIECHRAQEQLEERKRWEEEFIARREQAFIEEPWKYLTLDDGELDFEEP